MTTERSGPVASVRIKHQPLPPLRLWSFTIQSPTEESCMKKAGQLDSRASLSLPT